MAKNRDLLEEKGSEMAREGVFACVARIVWQLHRRQSSHSGRPRIGANPGTGSCTHAAHLTVAAHGPELFEGSRDRLPKLALKMLYESRRNHDLGTSLDARRHLKPGPLYYVCLFRSIGLYGHLRRPIR